MTDTLGLDKRGDRTVRGIDYVRRPTGGDPLLVCSHTFCVRPFSVCRLGWTGDSAQGHR